MKVNLGKFEVGFDFSSWAFLLHIGNDCDVALITFLCFYIFWVKK